MFKYNVILQAQGNIIATKTVMGPLPRMTDHVTMKLSEEDCKIDIVGFPYDQKLSYKVVGVDHDVDAGLVYVIIGHPSLEQVEGTSNEKPDSVVASPEAIQKES